MLWRAATSPIKFAADPPLVSRPPAVSGSPQERRNHSITSNSIEAAAEPLSQVPTKTLKPEASASAIVLTKFPGLGTKAKKRG